MVADVPRQAAKSVCVAKISEKRKSQALQTHLQNVLQQLLLILRANLENKHHLRRLKKGKCKSYRQTTPRDKEPNLHL